jgi:hypothetical protein
MILSNGYWPDDKAGMTNKIGLGHCFCFRAWTKKRANQHTHIQDKMQKTFVQFFPLQPIVASCAIVVLR